MSDLAQLADTLDRIRGADSLGALERALVTIRDTHGLATLAYHAVGMMGADGATPLRLTTYGDDGLRWYRDTGYAQTDPVVQLARRSALPQDWQDIARSSPAARAFVADAGHYGLGRNGLAFPIRGAQGGCAVFTVSAHGSDAAWTAMRLRNLRDFQTIGHYIHDRVAHLAPAQPAAPARAPSPQERRCLESLGRGRTPKQIAADLRVSESAVRLYLHSARQKLACATNTQAVSHALRLSIIEM